MDKSGKNYSGSLQTSIQAFAQEYFSISSMLSSMALLLLPQAGNTVSKRFKD